MPSQMLAKVRHVTVRRSLGTVLTVCRSVQIRYCTASCLLSLMSYEFAWKNKPNGQFKLDFESQAIKAFMHDLSIRKVPGVGRVNERLLDSIGIKVVPLLLMAYLVTNRFSTRHAEISSPNGLSSPSWTSNLA